MKDSIRIAPGFEHLRAEFERIPEGGYPVEHVFCNKRNVVEASVIGGIPAVIKRFRTPGTVNAFVYGRLRPSKADRSFDNALRLHSLGIDTPEPMAVITRPDGARFARSWYVCRRVDVPSMKTHLPNEKLPQLMELLQGDEILAAFLDTAAGFFGTGVYPIDFNRGNFLLLRGADGRWHFPMVDLNRMRFGRVSPRMVARALYLFTDGVSPGALREMTLRVCRRMGLPDAVTLRGLRSFRRALPWRTMRRKIKKNLKKILHRNK